MRLTPRSASLPPNTARTTGLRERLAYAPITMRRSVPTIEDAYWAIVQDAQKSRLPPELRDLFAIHFIVGERGDLRIVSFAADVLGADNYRAARWISRSARQLRARAAIVVFVHVQGGEVLIDLYLRDVVERSVATISRDGRVSRFRPSSLPEHDAGFHSWLRRALNFELNPRGLVAGF